MRADVQEDTEATNVAKYLDYLPRFSDSGSSLRAALIRRSRIQSETVTPAWRAARRMRSSCSGRSRTRIEVSCFLFSGFGVADRVAMGRMLWPPSVPDQGYLFSGPIGNTNRVAV